MELEKKSIFKVNSPTTLSEYLSNTLPSKANEDLDFLFRQEFVLNQQEAIRITELNKMEQHESNNENITSLRSSIDAFHRYYSYEEIIETEALLNFFEILEDTKYSKCIVQYDHLLHKYLYSSYTLSNFFLKDAKENFHSIINIDLNLPLFYGDSILPIWDEYQTGNRVNSIKKHFKDFITLQEEKSQDKQGYTLIRSVQRKTSQGSNRFYPKYYLPINQIPEFLFLFLFYDCRRFPLSYGTKDNNRIPKRSKKEKIESVASETSYKFVLKHIYSFYQHNFTFEKNMIKEKDLKYAKINYKNKLDKLFHYNTLEMLYHYYRLYTSDIFLNRVMYVFSLSYKETLCLAEHIIHCIFDDTDFIKEGLRSSFRDFLLPFDIHFQFTLLTVSNLKGLNGLNEVIAEGKRIAQIAWKTPYSYNLKEKLFSDIDLTTSNKKQILLNIESLQNNIISMLKNNNFYKTYFSDKNEMWIRYLESPDTLQGPISYETLKEILIHH